jgi:hypothetical protein
MKRTVYAALPMVALVGTITGCGPSASGAASTSTPDSTVTTHVSASLPPAPAAPTAAKTADCPYLDTSFVADTNGQHVSSVKISAGDGQPHPSCFFYRPDGKVQVSVRVYVGQPDLAQAVVNQAAPVATSDPASDPAGWQGGLLSGGYNGMNDPTGTATYAVYKGGDAVVVWVNQAQSIKARRITEQAISTLGL